MKTKLIIMTVLCAFMFTACEKEEPVLSNKSNISEQKVNKEEKVDANKSVSSFEQDIAFFDQRLRTINSNEYVREVVLVSFGGSYFGEYMTSSDTRFLDDGTGYDEVSGDGVYTSITTYNHDSSEPFVSVGNIKSVLDDAIVDTDFAYESELDAYAESYEHRDPNNPSPDIIKVICDIEFGLCGGCLASDFWGVCDCCCIRVSNCTKVEFGF